MGNLIFVTSFYSRALHGEKDLRSKSNCTHLIKLKSVSIMKLRPTVLLSIPVQQD